MSQDSPGHGIAHGSCSRHGRGCRLLPAACAHTLPHGWTCHNSCCLPALLPRSLKQPDALLNVSIWHLAVPLLPNLIPSRGLRGVEQVCQVHIVKVSAAGMQARRGLTLGGAAGRWVV